MYTYISKFIVFSSLQLNDSQETLTWNPLYQHFLSFFHSIYSIFPYYYCYYFSILPIVVFAFYRKTLKVKFCESFVSLVTRFHHFHAELYPRSSQFYFFLLKSQFHFYLFSSGVFFLLIQRILKRCIRLLIIQHSNKRKIIKILFVYFYFYKIKK